MLREEEIRKKVKSLKRFYMDIINFVIVSVILILIWMTFDRTGTFWPKYVMVVWGIALIFRAYRMGIVPFIFYRTVFLSPEWEEKKIKELLRRRDIHSKYPLDKDKGKEKDKAKKKK